MFSSAPSYFFDFGCYFDEMLMEAWLETRDGWCTVPGLPQGSLLRAGASSASGFLDVGFK